MGKLNIRLLGPIEFKRGANSTLGFESNKVRALIAYLVVESGRPHQRRRLAALLWPKMQESTALSNLRYALSNLRKVIGDRSAQPPFLLITPQTIQFNAHSNSWVDVFLFEKYCTLAQENPLDLISLHKAADLYRGRFMEGFSIPDSIPYEEWIVVKRERLDLLAYQVFHQLANNYELIGDFERALAFAQRQIELDPWREEVHQQIMRCLYYSGQRSSAIAQYETCCRSLSVDLGLEPSPDTKQLLMEIQQETLPQPPTPPAFFYPSANTQIDRPPFVGRAEPLSRLHTALNQALEGQGQLVLITGSPGQGKTALVHEFLHQALQTHSALGAAWGNSQAYFGSGDPFLPFREILEMLAGQVEHRWEAGSISHDHARRMWRLTEFSTQVLVQEGPSLIGNFIPGNVLLERAAKVLQNEPAWLCDLQKIVDQNSDMRPTSIQDLFQQYCRVVVGISQKVPLLLFVDDLQWADRASLGLFFHLSRQLTGARILLVGAFRPVDDHPGDGDPASLADMVNELRLRYGDMLIDLDLCIERRFIDALLDQEPNQLDEGFRAALFSYTNSHPLYTIEMLFDMKSQGNLIKNQAGEWLAAESLDWEHLPPRIEAAIEERLRRLPQSLLNLLKIASVEGERFTAEVISQVQKLDREQIVEQLRDDLDRKYKLVQAESSRRFDQKRLTRYRFRHILFQRYLYSQLDVVERAELHEQVASSIENHYSGILDEMFVPLAIHFELAVLPEKAISYYELSAARASRFSSYEDAIRHYEKALSLLASQPESMERNQREFDLLLKLSAPLMLARGFASEDMGINNDRMAALLKHIPMKVDMFPIFHAISAYYSMRGQHNKALDVLREGESLARRSEDELLLRIVNWGYGFTFLWLGKLEEALFHLEKMVEFYDPKLHHDFHRSYGMDAGVGSHLWSSWALWLLGFTERALMRGQKAIDLSHLLDDSGNQMFAMDITGFLRLLIGETQGFNELIYSIERLLEKSPSPLHAADLKFLRGLYHAQIGQLELGITLMSQGVEAFQACGTRSQLNLRKTILAEALMDQDQLDRASQTIDQAQALTEETNERFYQAEVLRVKGRLLEKAGNLKEAETCYQNALQIAGQQKAKTLELRAAINLARLWQGQARTTEAYQLLAEVYSWFTEGFQTADLQEAQRLLESLQHNLVS
jgi:DNA-binding SARP family transcriptional activator